MEAALQSLPPQIDELELSLFGPGIGECLVVHLGAGKWMVVDSCLNEARDEPIALAYFDQIGVDVATDVKLVVVSHWHDDHIEGISRVLKASESARFACSGALNSKEFLKLVLASERTKLVRRKPGLAEFGEILDILKARHGGKYAAAPDRWIHDGTLLYTDNDPCLVEVFGLSPSAQTVADGLGTIAAMFPTHDTPIRRFPAAAPNNLSAVLLVKTQGHHVLLGGDLEVGADGLRGWRAVVGSDVRPKVRCEAYKVAHHGSDNADLPAIWTELLGGDPFAVLTPYSAGPKPRPAPDDVARIKASTSNAYCTVWPPTKSAPKRPGAVDRTIRKWRSLAGRCGNIRGIFAFEANSAPRKTVRRSNSSMVRSLFREC
jgi:hypothetical protein